MNGEVALRGIGAGHGHAHAWAWKVRIKNTCVPCWVSWVAMRRVRMLAHAHHGPLEPQRRVNGEVALRGIGAGHGHAHAWAWKVRIKNTCVPCWVSWVAMRRVHMLAHAHHRPLEQQRRVEREAQPKG